MSKYPPAMLKFIARSTGRVDNNTLREVVNSSIRDGTMNTISWDDYDLPRKSNDAQHPAKPAKPAKQSNQAAKPAKKAATAPLRAPPKKSKPAQPTAPKQKPGQPPHPKKGGPAPAPAPVTKQKGLAPPHPKLNPPAAKPAKGKQPNKVSKLDPNIQKLSRSAKRAALHEANRDQNPKAIGPGLQNGVKPNKHNKPVSANLQMKRKEPENNSPSESSGTYADWSDSVVTTKKARTDRLARFTTAPEPQLSIDTDETSAPSDGPIVGTSTALEKDYFRITGPVKPHTVRPLEILELAFNFVMKKYHETKNYNYIRNQFQAIRQDLRVQHLTGRLTLEVYATNTRLALANDDFGEFNKCLQATLDLRSQNKEFTSETDEFVALNILYMLRFGRWDHLSATTRELELELEPENSDSNIILSALEILSALNRGDKRKLFVCCKNLSDLAQKVIEPILRREQLAAIAEMVWACRSVPASFIAEALTLEKAAFEELLERNAVPLADTYQRAEHYDAIYKALTAASAPIKL